MSSCRDCRFWKIQYESDVADTYANGYCRNSPPTINGFPRVVADQWCGAYQSTEPPPRPTSGLIAAGWTDTMKNNPDYFDSRLDAIQADAKI
jgi:hypothetical protein